MDTQTDTKKRIIRLAVALFVLVVAVLVLIYFGVIKSPSTSIPTLQKKPTVQLKTEYNNPFKKETQYVNPFETYKNPFVVNR